MHSAVATPDEVLGYAIAAVRRGEAEMRSALDGLAAPIYTTDRDGRVTFANRACAAFAGREPQPGEDRWCVTWKLYGLDGQFLPHDRCPMAVAIREERAIRGVEAIAERPDGTRVRFRPYPTPILDEHGEMTGAVNMLLDIDSLKQADHFSAQASKCRRLARSVMDRQAAETLALMASEYEDKARLLQRLN